MKRMTWNWLLALLLVPLNSIRPAVGAEAVAVIAIDADPGHFNPAITTGAHVHAVADSIFNGLVGLDQWQMPTPDLAAAWQVSADGRTYTFRLVEARWHDGEPFTSADVKFTFENVLLKWHARTKAGLGEVIEAIDAPDPRTVIFRLKAPHAAFLRRLDVTEAPTLPRPIRTTPKQTTGRLAPGRSNLRDTTRKPQSSWNATRTTSSAVSPDSI